MKCKQKCGKECLAELISKCENSYSRWKDIYENGCSDPNWADGVNLNLVRNHIIYYKKKILAICVNENLDKPTVLTLEDPTQVDSDFMSKADELKKKGLEFKAKMENHIELTALLEEIKRLTAVQRENPAVSAVLHERKRLYKALDEDDFVNIRNLLRWKDEFFINVKKALAVAKEFPTEPVQLTMFDTS